MFRKWLKSIPPNIYNDIASNRLIIVILNDSVELTFKTMIVLQTTLFKKKLGSHKLIMLRKVLKPFLKNLKPR